MTQSLAYVTVVVRDYDEAIAFYTGVLGFDLIEDSYQAAQDKRWVLVRPKGSAASLLLARATDSNQSACIGNQSSGRVFLFLETDDFWRDYEIYRSRGVKFLRDLKQESYGIVAVFADFYGNLWDLIERAANPT